MGFPFLSTILFTRILSHIFHVLYQAGRISGVVAIIGYSIWVDTNPANVTLSEVTV